MWVLFSEDQELSGLVLRIWMTSRVLNHFRALHIETLPTTHCLQQLLPEKDSADRRNQSETDNEMMAIAIKLATVGNS